MAGVNDIEFSKYMSMDEETGHWYVSRKEIEENSPSRRDGIDLKKETYFRKSYCTFLRELGMRLRVPQATIATAMVYCHRFFFRQSHATNNRLTIATVCMFLAGKVEETPRQLKEVIQVSYCLIYDDPFASLRIKQKDVYEPQKELILLGETVVLVTLAFDFKVHHPYKSLVEGIKKFKMVQHELARVAWNFVNDGLRTSICLQFKPQHIAASAIFLAAKLLKIKLPSDGGKLWWQEFGVTPLELEEISKQILELYDQTQIPKESQLEGSSSSVHNQYDLVETTTAKDDLLPSSGPVPVGGGPMSSSGKPVAVKHTQSETDDEDNYNAVCKHLDDGCSERSCVINN